MFVGANENSCGVPVLTAFSFYATKNLTTGEGGMLTGPPDLIESARAWSLHGILRDAWNREQSSGDAWFYEVIEPGFKYNMSDIQAAMGIAQLARTGKLAKRRNAIATRYNEAFRNREEIEIPAHRPDIGHSWHIYALRLHLDKLGITRSAFISHLRKRNIAASVHFIPIHLHRYYADRYGFKPHDFPVAHREYERLVSLPIYPAMTDGDVQDVIDAVKDVAGSTSQVSRSDAAVEA
jgi:dTDP-4-amino-4,6-dideoxygalactose transaminase